MKVSVCITTYNHEKFIAEALDSVLNQETKFDYEILIGEDQSSDNTRENVLDYAKRYPDKIKVFLHDYPDDYVRINGRQNFVNNLKNARGEYIALLDGDDYWTNTRKLEKQVSFLDSHPDFSTVFHRADWLENGLITEGRYGPPEVKDFYTTDDLLKSGNIIPTCSAMFRKGLFGEIPDWFYKSPYGDFPLHILNSFHGKIGFINESMSVYRAHAGGRFAGKSKIYNLINQYHCYEILSDNLHFSDNPFYQQFVNTVRSNIFQLVKDASTLTEAIQVIDRLIEDYPNHIALRLLQADLKIKAGEIHSAKDILSEVLRRTPGNSEALSKRALLETMVNTSVGQ